MSCWHPLALLADRHLEEDIHLLALFCDVDAVLQVVDDTGCEVVLAKVLLQHCVALLIKACKVGRLLDGRRLVFIVVSTQIQPHQFKHVFVIVPFVLDVFFCDFAFWVWRSFQLYLAFIFSALSRLFEILAQWIVLGVEEHNIVARLIHKWVINKVLNNLDVVDVVNLDHYRLLC